MDETHYAIVFTKEFLPGEHWPTKAPAEESDLRQHWQIGDLYSIGTVIADPLPDHLAAIVLPAPPAPGAVWDRTTRTFVKGPHSEE